MIKTLLKKQIAIPLIIAVLALTFMAGYKCSTFFSDRVISEKDLTISELREQAALQDAKIQEYKKSIAETIIVQNKRIERVRKKAEEENQSNLQRIKELEDRDMTTINKVDCEPIDKLINEGLGL